MAEISNYCKAYSVVDVAKFAAVSESLRRWQERPLPQVSSEEQEILRSYVFLHDNYTLTGTIWLDEEPIYWRTDSGWIQFCTETLKFEVPEYAKEESAEEVLPGQASAN